MEAPESPASQLSTFFNTHRGTPVHIEFHPSSPTNPDSRLLVDGPNIAIPKPFLIKAFLSANATFAWVLARSPEPKQWSAEDAKTLVDTSLIILLVGAENLTAVNVRRRILLQDLFEVITPREEVKWLEGVLTSPLAKHNKSPSLWYYRRWLVGWYGVGILGGGAGEGLEGEMGVVERSGEKHPRNYYAWNYARFITDTFYTLHQTTTPPIQVLIDRHALFCLAHVSDTSCWSFLLFLFFRAVELGQSSIANLPRRYLFDITKDVMCFGHDTARGHESVWVFLKTVLVSDGLLEGEQREHLIELLESWVKEGASRGESEVESEEAKERELERKALEWVRRRGRK